MKIQRKISRMFLATVGMFLLTSVSVILLLFPEGDRSNTMGVTSIITGVLFWIGILGGTGFYLFTYLSNREEIHSRIAKGKVPSFVRFYSNRYAAIADTLFFISLTVIVYSSVHINVNEIVQFISLIIFVTSVYAHFILNGKVFEYMFYLKKGR